MAYMYVDNMRVEIEGEKNVLEVIRKAGIEWSMDDNKMVTLHIENKGVFNTLAQKILKQPKVSYVHLDEIGSFIWPLIDGKKNIAELGKDVEKHFGDKANPLYERLAKYFQILDSYHFVEWKN